MGTMAGEHRLQSPDGRRFILRVVADEPRLAAERLAPDGTVEIVSTGAMSCITPLLSGAPVSRTGLP